MPIDNQTIDSTKPNNGMLEPKKSTKIKDIIFGSQRRKTLFTIVIILLTVVIAGVAFYFVVYRPNRPVITINGQKIYKKDIQRVETLYLPIWKNADNKEIMKNTYEAAKSKIVEDTIVSTESKKRGLSVTQQEVDQQYQSEASDYDSVKQFEEANQSIGWKPSDEKYRIQLELLKTKLKKTVVNAYTGKAAYVRYDVYGDDQAKLDEAKIKAEEFRKLLLAGHTVENVIKTYETSERWGSPLTGMQKFNFINASNEKNKFEGREDWQNISKLNKSGDVTAVYKSGGGYFAVAVLESKGDGGFDSWEAFIASFKPKTGLFSFSGYKKLISLFINASPVAHIPKLYKLINGVAYAVTCTSPGLYKDGTCCKVNWSVTQHKSNAHFIITDKGVGVNGIKVSLYYHTDYHNLCNSETNFNESRITGSGSFAKGEAWFYGMTCWAHYSVDITDPQDRFKPIHINDISLVNGDWDDDFHYDVDLQNWSLEGRTKADKDEMYVGDTATFTHIIWNAGPQDMDNSESFSSQVNWASGSATTTVTWLSDPVGDPPADHQLPRNASPHGHKDVGDAQNNTIIPRQNSITPTSPGEYCQLISWWPKSKRENGAKASSKDCVTVLSKPWNITGSSSVDRPVAMPGETVYFSHSDTNQGPWPTNETVWGNIQWTTYDNVGQNPPSYIASHSHAAGWAALATNSHAAPAFRIPGTIDDTGHEGWRYCQNISWTPISDSNTGWGNSAPACVTIHIPHWNITPSSTVSAKSPAGVVHNQPAGANRIFVNRGDVVNWVHSAAVNGENTTKVVNLKSQWTTSPGGTLNNDAHPTNWSSGSPYSYSPDTFNVPDDAVNGAEYCQNITATPQSWDNTSELGGTPVCVVVTEPSLADYTAVSIPSSDYEKGMSTLPTWNMGIRVNRQPCNLALPNGATIPANWSNTGSGGVTQTGSVNFANCSNAAIPDSVGIRTVTLAALGINTSSFITASLPTSYSRTTAVTSGPVTIPPSATGTMFIYESPYSRFYGNDIYARSGEIFFNKNTNTGRTGGAGAVQYASIAYTAVNNINVNINHSFSPDLSAKWLSGQAPNSQYDDVISNLPANPTDPAPPPSTTMTINGNSIPDNTYYSHTGDLTMNFINGNFHTRFTLYVDGDINIKNDLTLPPGQFTRRWSATDLPNIPVSLIVASGNVYIENTVSRLDAIIIAKNTIYTCSSGFSEVSRGNWQRPAASGGCSNKLTINGAIAAQNIRFGRSIGTRLLGAPGEPSNETTDYSASRSSAAEVINFPAYLYFAGPHLRDGSAAGFQSIFNAAPLL